METKGIHIGEAIRFGWKTMKSNIGFFIGLLLVAWVIQLVPQTISSVIQNGDFDLSLGAFLVLIAIFTIISIVLSSLITMGLIKVSLKFCDNEKGSIGDLFSTFPLFFKYLLGLILYILILIAGAILLVFPAVIWGIKYSLFPYFIVEKGAGPIEALKLSSETTMGAKWDLLGFWWVISIINLLGFFSLIIGIFASFPTTMVASALVYRKLLSQTESEQSTQPAAETAGA